MKLVAVEGDVTLPGFGLSHSDRHLLCENVSVVFNLAATVRFDEDLKTAVKMNVMGPRQLLAICRDMKQLKVQYVCNRRMLLPFFKYRVNNLKYRPWCMSRPHSIIWTRK